MSKESVTIAEIIEAATEDGNWVNGEFEAIVQDAKAGVGRKPSKARLVDPDNLRVSVNASMYGDDLTRYEGAKCLFSGQGMKIKLYRDKPELTIGDKARVNKLSEGAAPARSTAPSAEPVARKVEPKNPAERATKFHAGMKRITLLWMHAQQYAHDAWPRIPDGSPLKSQAGGFQALVSSIFITAKDHGLIDYAVPLREWNPDMTCIPFSPPKPTDDEEKARAAAEEVERQRREEEARRRAEEEARRAAEDEDVPF